MRAIPGFWLSLLAVSWLGCASATRPSVQAAWDGAEVECDDPGEDACVTLVCLDDVCGFYRCEELPADVEQARFPPSRPPAAAAAPGSGPRRNWGAAQQLPPGSVMTFPNWNGAPSRVIPPSHRLTPGRWEKHHIFPQASDLALWFERQGVKIHDYTMPIPLAVHRRIHDGTARGGAWNDAWRQFRRANPDASSEAIFKHAGELIYRFQLSGDPIRPYYSKPGA
ncbi:TIGR02269 family lipoprotein [Myxococcus sp. K15C18031901]|uniref:SitA6 family polymorphic toxin lipoprotein n=1 Tax=Myxococcus dinghuensis TaxID=2906761 RepID=UPI0020A803B9|nr:TIGR02269 family lipoprotein [Myxococcus dinghuensis]MCP3097495.1 TIGR02269 family lipoprotein [Myxococcus dinghuensis]